MQWLVIFITYVNMVRELHVRAMLFRMALYHLWELYAAFDGDQPCTPSLWPVRATLAMWRGMVHMGYQELRIQIAGTPGEPLPPCSCALCAPPPERLFTPGYFWHIWKAANLPMCSCPVCLQRPPGSPYDENVHREATTQTDPPPYPYSLRHVRRPPPLVPMGSMEVRHCYPTSQPLRLSLGHPPRLARSTLVVHGPLPAPPADAPMPGPSDAATDTAGSSRRVAEPLGDGLRLVIRRQPIPDDSDEE